jgi:GDP-L-fucose synthase
MNLPKTDLINTVPDPMCSHINVGTGVDCTIAELAQTMAKVVGFQGDLVFDSSKPDGTRRKLLSVQRLADLGWRYTTNLETGLQQTYQWFLQQEGNIRG